MFSFLMYVPPAEPVFVALLCLLSAWALWICRHDLGYASKRMRWLFVLAFVFLFTTPTLYAIDIYATCDWYELLEYCGGFQICAWGWWYTNGCMFR